MSVLDQILARTANDWPRSGEPLGSKLCVVACSDPAVSALLPRVLGTEDEEFVALRLPGPVVRAGSEDLAKAVATVIALHGCGEVLVLAHTDCCLVTTQSSMAAGMLSSRDFDRARLPEDVRSFFALQASPRQIAIETAGAIRSAPYMPPGLLVHAVLLDSASGALTVLERGENAAVAPAPRGSSLFGASGPVDLGGGSPAGSGIGVSNSFDAGRRSGPVTFDDAMPPQLQVEGHAPDISRTKMQIPDIDPNPSRIEYHSTPLEFKATAPPRSSITFAPSTIDMTPSQFDLSPSAMVLETTPIKTQSTPPRSPPAPLPRTEKRPFSISSTPTAPRPAAPVRKPQTAGPLPTPAPRSPGAPRPKLAPDLLAKLDKVRDFYRMELEPSVRVEVGRALAEALAAGASNSELIKSAFRPVLESGPKRYKVIDELLAIKEAAGGMDSRSCYSLLRQLVD